MKLLIIAATHGNERLGIRLYQQLLRRRSPLLEHIDFVIGNPRAYTAKKRYIDTDLNRCYTGAGAGYEAERVKEIATHIAATRPDIVLDMHTTSCEQPSCLIVSDTSGIMRQRFLAASHISTVLMVQALGDIASIGNNVVGYEVPEHHITATLLDAICLDLQRFIDGSMGKPHKQLYEMTDKIYKTEVTPKEAATFINFQMHELGYVPIMTGENSYKKQTDYLGFKSLAPRALDLKTAIIEGTHD